MQMRDWFFHSKELALFPGDIPSSEPAGQLLPGGPAPQQVGIDILLPWTLPGFTATAANSSDHSSRCKGKEKSGGICSSNNFE